MALDQLAEVVRQKRRHQIALATKRPMITVMHDWNTLIATCGYFVRILGKSSIGISSSALRGIKSSFRLLQGEQRRQKTANRTAAAMTMTVT